MIWYDTRIFGEEYFSVFLRVRKVIGYQSEIMVPATPLGDDAMGTGLKECYLRKKNILMTIIKVTSACIF